MLLPSPPYVIWVLCFFLFFSLRRQYSNYYLSSFQSPARVQYELRPLVQWESTAASRQLQHLPRVVALFHEEVMFSRNRKISDLYQAGIDTKDVVRRCTSLHIAQIHPNCNYAHEIDMASKRVVVVKRNDSIITWRRIQKDNLNEVSRVETPRFQRPDYSCSFETYRSNAMEGKNTLSYCASVVITSTEVTDDKAYCKGKDEPIFSAKDIEKAYTNYFDAINSEECKKNSARWRILVTANSAYDEDFLSFWAHANRTGLFDSRTTIVLYAEDQIMFDAYNNSTKMLVKRAWDVDTRWNDQNLTGTRRFSYSEQEEGFRKMMSRRGAIVANELRIADLNDEMLLYLDVDVSILKDPRPFFCGNFDLYGQDAMVFRTGPINGGLWAMRPSNVTNAMVESWRSMLESRKEAGSNQKAFNDAVREMESSGLRTTLLPQTLFPVGRILKKTNRSNAACQGSKVLRDTGIWAFHNNWCSESEGCEKKSRAKRLGFWQPLKRELIL